MAASSFLSAPLPSLRLLSRGFLFQVPRTKHAHAPPPSPAPSGCGDHPVTPHNRRTRRRATGEQRLVSDFPWESDVPCRSRAVSTSASLVSTAGVDGSLARTDVKRSAWEWKYEGRNLRISVVEHSAAVPSHTPTVILLPSPSDVSTVDEWAQVAKMLSSQPEKEKRVVVVDFPGFGASDSPPLDYTSDMLEKFIVDFVAHHADDEDMGLPPPVIIGAGHAATLAVKAASKNLLPASALVAVCPTWGGPLPIVFGKSEKMQLRYDLLRNVLRSPGLGWALYKYVLSSPKNIRSQYISHVYADKKNVTESLLGERVSVTQREGARFAPASFVSGRLDPVSSREEFLALFEPLQGKVPTLVISSTGCPRRSKAEMESLEGARGVDKFIRVPGALLPHEEYPEDVGKQVMDFLDSSIL